MALVGIEIDPLREPVPDGWTDFVARNRLSVRWDAELLRAVSWCAQAPSSLVMVRDSGSGEAVAVFHARHVGLQDPRRFAAPGRVPALGLIECRISPMLDAGMAFAEQLDERGRREALSAFERVVHGRAGARARPVTYRSVPEDLLGTVATDGRRIMRQSPVMVLHREWSDLEGYLATLPTRMSGRLGRLYEALEGDESITVEVVDEVEPHEVVWLTDTVRRRRQRGTVPFPPAPSRYFQRLNAIADCRYLVYRDSHGRLLALLTLYDDGMDLHSGIWGYRSEADGGRRNLYFDVYLRQVEMMASLGRRRLLLGAGMEELKARFGARPEHRYGALALRSTSSSRRVPAGEEPTGAGDPPRATGPTAQVGGRRSLLVRLGRLRQRAERREGVQSGRTELRLECRQCGQWWAVSVLGTRFGVRYWCRRCGAVATGDSAALRPAAEFRAAAATTGSADRTDPVEAVRELLPGAMVEWMRSRSRRLPTPEKLNKQVIYQLYRAWDRHLAAAAPDELAALAVAGEPAPVPGLPSFAAVVTAVNGACYRGDLALARLARSLPADAPAGARPALFARVEHARRWLAHNGGDLCWVHQLAPDGELAQPDREEVVAAAAALRAGGDLDPTTCDTLRAALFGAEKGPRFTSLRDAYPVESMLAGLETYLESGDRPLRRDIVARLQAPPAVEPPARAEAAAQESAPGVVGAGLPAQGRAAELRATEPG